MSEKDRIVEYLESIGVILEDIESCLLDWGIRSDGSYYIQFDGDITINPKEKEQ